MIARLGSSALKVLPIFVTAFAACSWGLGHGKSMANTPPNIVMILADDLSWVGTSVQMDPNMADSKSDYHQTPNLEQLATQAMVFSKAYAPSAVCAPSRASIETGKSPTALRVTDLRQGGRYYTAYFQSAYNGHPLTPPLPRPALINPAETTLGKMLKEVNSDYQTAVFGKFSWWPPAPGEGYDEAIAFTPANSDPNDPKSMFSIANAGIDFMERKVAENKPFFVNFANWATKPTNEARPATIAEFQSLPPGVKHTDVTYAAMHKDFDTTIGMVMDKITELGIEDNTYLFVTSDHGAPIEALPLNNRPLYGGKGTLYEGGIRVPLIAAGPGIAGSYSDVPVSLFDLFPTFQELAGSTALPADVEGTSLVSLLQNGGNLEPGQTSLQRKLGPNGELFFHYPNNVRQSLPFIGVVGPHSAVVDGDFKLIRRYGENGAPDSLLLFNLNDNILEDADPNSPLNLALLMPQKVAELESKLDNWLQDLDASQAYDVSAPVQLSWRADRRGSFTGVPDIWRSTVDVDSFDREIWVPASGSPGPSNGVPPTLGSSAPHQPGLPNKAFHFDGSQGFVRRYFHVSDSVIPDEIDADHSATFSMWVHLDDLASNHLLFESGHSTQGISLTLGDADGDLIADDLRFRVLGAQGNFLSVTNKINQFANPTDDFVHITAVVNDADTERYAELYINGALVGRVDGIAGPDELDWDGFQFASLGKLDVNTHFWSGQLDDSVGGNSGGGDLPFTGGNLRGDIATFQFYNYSLSASEILSIYNSALHPVDFGVHSVAGQATVPSQRAANVSLDSEESSSLLVMQERSDTLDNVLAVEAIINGPITLNSGNTGTLGSLLAGTDFTSYLLQFDPASNNGALIEAVIGSITFQQEILAILFDPVSLADSDALLGVIGDYGVQTDRGLLLAGGDFLDISSDSRTLSFDLSIPGDELLQFRVLTEQVLAADLNNDGFVDGADLAIWELAYGSSDAGDVDFDGDTDGNDFLIWQQQFLGAAPFAAATQVPEPTTLVIVLMAGLLLAQSTYRLRLRQVSGPELPK